MAPYPTKVDFSAPSMRICPRTTDTAAERRDSSIVVDSGTGRLSLSLSLSLLTFVIFVSKTVKINTFSF